MAAHAHYPGTNAAYVPNHEASGKLVVDFSRNIKEFALNRYVQLVPVTQSLGYYLKMTVEEAGRIVNGDLSDFLWADGSDAPEDLDGTESFQFLAYATERYKYGYRMGHKTSKQASWDIIAQHGAIKSQQAMTARTTLVSTLATTAANYASDHTSAVASITGNTGTWAASTTARQDIKRSLNTAAEKIMLDTLGAVKPEQLHLVICPTDARKLAETQEIVDYIKGSPESLAQIKGELPGNNVMFGLPDKLYGFNIEVESAVRVTTRKRAATTTRQFVWPAGKAVMMARPGELVGTYGAPSFSTITLFMYEEMTVETLEDNINRLTRGRVIEDFSTVMTAPVSGYLFTSIA